MKVIWKYVSKEESSSMTSTSGKSRLMLLGKKKVNTISTSLNTDENYNRLPPANTEMQMAV